MYKKVIRPILFLIPPEIIHRIIVTALRVIHYIPGSRMLLRAFCAVRHPSLEREVFGIRPGDTLLVLGDIERGLALVKNDAFMQFAQAIFDAQDPKEESK